MRRKGYQKAERYSVRRILQYGRNSRRIISARNDEKEILPSYADNFQSTKYTDWHIAI